VTDHDAIVQKSIDGKMAGMVDSVDEQEWFRTLNVMKPCRDNGDEVTKESEALVKGKASKFSFSSRKKVVTFALPDFGDSVMSGTGKMSDEAQRVLNNMTLYQWFREEREEILRHKWFESQKLGRDIGFEAALTDWIINHRAGWRQARMAEHGAHGMTVNG
jgi:hypothetical protein